MSKLTVIAAACLFAACGESSAVKAAVEPAAPLAGVTDAYAFARKQMTGAPEPHEYPGLHNVVKLSERIVSGSEPHGEQAFEAIAAMGVKTILSVDGKVPDAALAKKYGMRYVHVPIQYSGIKSDALAKIAKTFRELEGPFFVHCFHGKHRGPASAAVGRIVLDGVPRERALAEMVHCGVAGKYEGLYRTVGTTPMPASKDTQALAWNFDAAHPLRGIRAGMIELTRSFDHLKALGKRNWAVDPEHPDIDAANEAAKIAQLFDRMNESDELAEKPGDYRRWMQRSRDVSRTLFRALKGDEAETARRYLAITKGLCASCHKSYRNADG